MNCPICRDTPLEAFDLEANLLSQRCARCGGHWVNSFQYWRWRREQGPSLPEKPAQDGANLPVTDSRNPKVCPECGHILIKYRVGHDIPFALDHCGFCGGTWFDGNEWETLRSRNLHDDAHLIFSQVWQAHVARAEREQGHEETLTQLLGEEDLAEIRRIRAWLESHPRKHELYAYLLHAQP